MSYFIFKIKQQIIEAIAESLGESFDFSEIEITKPPQSSMGDFSVPCFYFSKLTRLSPNQIASDLKNRLKLKAPLKSVQNIGPYLNFHLDDSLLAKNIITDIKKQQNKYGCLKSRGEKIMIEYSQPNTHKEFHVGHLRNVVLGSALVNLNRCGGYKVLAVNYIGDIGSHVAKCLWAYQKFHQQEPEPQEHKGQYLGKLYTEAVNLCEADESAKLESAEVQKKLEAGDKKLVALWKKTRQWSLQEFDAIYKILGVKFDKVFYESEVEKPGKQIVKELLDNKIAELSEGAVIIDLEKYDLKKFLLLKSDGSSLYSTKELALAKLKFEKYKIDASYVVVDSRQSFYFKQFFKTLEVMGFKQKVKHINYEFVTLPDGAMSSRKGNVVLFEDFLSEMTSLALAETQKRHTDWTSAELEETAKKIALGAIKFAMIKTGRNNIITFNPQEALAFEGFSGPYLQYMVTRINSILRKAGIKDFPEADYAKLNLPQEKSLLLLLADYPEIIANAVNELEPSGLAQYLFVLAKDFSSYYQDVSVINSSSDIKPARLALVLAVRQVLVNGLSLLGIETMDKM